MSGEYAPRENAVDESGDVLDEEARSLTEDLPDLPVAEEENDELAGPPSALEIVSGERDEYLDALRRLQAEFDNYRKRTARQQSDLVERATESLLEALLPVMDAFDLATVHAASSDDAAESETLETFARIGALLRDTLAKQGLERIDEVEVEFDPTIHDAVAHVDGADGDKPGHHLIDEILRSGYQLKGRVLRPAMVRVRG